MNKEAKLKILQNWLDNISFEGVNDSSLEKAFKDNGYAPQTAHAIYHHGVSQALKELSLYFDDQMLHALENKDTEALSIREKIKTATMTRINLMNEHKESYRRITAYWANPLRSFQAKKLLWHTADSIWKWAGDTSTDYNHYTKRGLLSGVLATTYIYWQQSSDEDLNKTEDFLTRRIENVVKFGKFINTFKQHHHQQQTHQ